MTLPKLETPTFELTLPSTGKKIKYRPFLVKEHKVLLSMAEAEDKEISRIIRELVDVCTFKALKVGELPHFDIEYIFMNLRARSIGESVDVVIACECGNKIETSFNIDNLKIDKNPEHTSKFMLSNEFGVEMQYPTIDEVLGVFADEGSEDIFNLVIKSIKAVYSKTEYWETKNESRESIEEFLYSLTSEQFNKLETFFITSPKIVQEIETDCPVCGKHTVSRLEGLQNFFV